MRDIINISLSKELSKEIDNMVKRGKYSTRSEFIRDLIREKIEESELLAELRKSQTEIKQGKGKILRSLKDLR